MSFLEETATSFTLSQTFNAITAIKRDEIKFYKSQNALCTIT